MNYLAHGLAFLDRPYVLAGSAVPDWLLVADRQVRVRSRHVTPWAVLSQNNPHRGVPKELEKKQFGPSPRLPSASAAASPVVHDVVAEVAWGICQHLADDAHFHHTAAFGELSLTLSRRVRELLQTEGGFYTAFVGHLLLEVLLDAALILEAPWRLETYYRVLDMLDVGLIQEAVNRMAPRSTLQLAPMIVEFRRLRILWDYLEDDKLWRRLNQVMCRVGLPELPCSFQEILPEARQAVAQKKSLLLEGIPVKLFFPEKGFSC